jgi:hypothetical protein
MPDSPTPSRDPVSRREALGRLAAASMACALPRPLLGRSMTDPDHARLGAWAATLRQEGLCRDAVPLGRAAARVGELSAGTPYVAHTLEAYLAAKESPQREPLILSLTRFDCVTLVESCLAVARAASRPEPPSWESFGREVERMRYRGGARGSYASRLHYFSEWISDGARRGLVRDLGSELGGESDTRPLRFMSEHRASYRALADDRMFREIARIEQGLDGHARRVVPTSRIDAVADRIETGDVLAFATSIRGLDVTHSAFAYRDSAGVLRVLHAPLSGGVVEVTRTTLPEYVRAIRRATGVLVARPLRG